MYTIGEFSNLAHVSARSLRYYDAMGLLRPRIWVKTDTAIIQAANCRRWQRSRRSRVMALHWQK